MPRDYARRAQQLYLDTGTRFPREIIWAMGLIKYAAARANMELGLLDEARGRAIMEVALRLARGDYDDRVIVDVFQTGSGTGINMNINEIIAEEASKIAGMKVHPNDHVNMSQSSNDTVPTAIRLAGIKTALEALQAVQELAEKLREYEEKWKDLVKPGRTHLRDALPVTLGAEIGAYAWALERDLETARKAVDNMHYIPLGGTAVGTGLNTHPRYRELAIKHLSQTSGLNLKPSPNPMTEMRLLTDLELAAASLRTLAKTLWRLADDLRLMASGPNTGLAELELTLDLPGSSMMPGKTNPVTLEAILQAAAHISGLEKTIENAGHLGELELSMGIPLAGYAIVTLSKLLTQAAKAMAHKALPTLKPRPHHMRNLATKSQALITILTPIIGYEKAAQASKLLTQGHPPHEIAEKLGIPPHALELLQKPELLTKPGIPTKQNTHNTPQ